MNKTRKDIEVSDLFWLSYSDFPFPLQLFLQSNFKDCLPSLTARKPCELTAPLEDISRILEGISNFPDPSGTQV